MTASTADRFVAEFDKERQVPRLSIVIPCPGGAAEFDGTLVSTLQNRPADCEVLVVHRQPYDDPYGLGAEVRFIQAEKNHLTGLLNTALEHARGELIHVLGCGLTTVEGWTAPAIAHFDDPEVATVSPIVLAGDGQRVHSAGVRWTLGGTRKPVSDQRVLLPGAGRLRAKILGSTLVAGFYRRNVLAALGGFGHDQGDQLADVALALAIGELGRLHVCEPDCRLLLGQSPPVQPGQGFRAGRAAECLFWRYARERGLPLSLSFHAAAVLADTLNQAPRLTALTSLVGRAAAWCDFNAPRRHQLRISSAAEQLEATASQRATIRLPAADSRPAATAPANQRRAA